MRGIWMVLVSLVGASLAGLDEGPTMPMLEQDHHHIDLSPLHTTEAPCELRVLPSIPKPPPTAKSDREIASGLASSLARLVARRSASPDKAASLARAALASRPDLLAVALGVPQINLGLLHFRNHLIIFQRNNTSSLTLYWRALAGSWNKSEGTWAPPWRDCGRNGTSMWLQGYSISITVEDHRAAAAVFMPLYLDQCDPALAELFGGPHKCDPDTTVCIPEAGWGMQRGGYKCGCRQGHYCPRAPTSWTGFPGEMVERDLSNSYRCVPCPAACESCSNNGACEVKRDPLVRGTLLAAQATCMTVTATLAVVVFKQRKCKTIASGMWTILETILLGIFLLYSTVVVRFFEPSVEQCLVEPWFRELGFIVCYGAIILKLYRHLIEFRTRKAHRWVVRDVDLLKYLLAMVVAVLCYLSAFTASSLNFIREQYSILRIGQTTSGQLFLACKPLWWDYVTEAGEMFILVFGIHLSYASRNASTQFQERRFLCAAICVEAAMSGVFYILRAMYVTSLHPDHVYMAYFIRSQLTSTVVILLIFTPKLWYQHKQVRSLAQEFSCRLPVDAFRGGDSVVLSDADVAELSISDMSPEDIRAELKRLYTQLELLRSKTLRADNPHISKRRGGRKVAHRRFSLQKKGSKEKALHGKKNQQRTQEEITECEPSRTPEDSVCSNEGPSAFTDGPSVAYSEPCFGTPRQTK